MNATKTKYTKREAILFVRRCGENDGPNDYARAAALFRAIFGREPDRRDGGTTMIWSQVCAAVK